MKSFVWYIPVYSAAEENLKTAGQKPGDSPVNQLTVKDLTGSGQWLRNLVSGLAD